MNIIRIIRYFIPALFLCSGICIAAATAGDYQSSERIHLEEARASWEEDSGGRIIGRLVTCSALKGGSYSMNMLCSAGSMKELKDIRSALNSIIVSEHSSYSMKLTASRHLAGVAKSDLSAITVEEELAIKKAFRNECRERLFIPGAYGSSPFNTELSATVPVLAAPNRRTKAWYDSLPSGKKTAFRVQDKSCGITAEFETGHADYYRLYLYVRDHTGIADDSYTITSPAPSFYSFLPYIKRKLKTQQAPDRDHSMPGPVPAAFFNTTKPVALGGTP